MTTEQIKDQSLRTAPASTDMVAVDDASNVTWRETWGVVLAPWATTAVSTATLTPISNPLSLAIVTAQGEAITIAAPSGSPAVGWRLLLRLKDDGTGRAITWNAIYRAIGFTLPTTTVASKTLYAGFIYNATDTKWDCLVWEQES